MKRVWSLSGLSCPRAVPGDANAPTRNRRLARYVREPGTLLAVRGIVDVVRMVDLLSRWGAARSPDPDRNARRCERYGERYVITKFLVSRPAGGREWTPATTAGTIG